MGIEGSGIGDRGSGHDPRRRATDKVRHDIDAPGPGEVPSADLQRPASALTSAIQPSISAIPFVRTTGHESQVFPKIAQKSPSGLPDPGRCGPCEPSSSTASPSSFGSATSSPCSGCADRMPVRDRNPDHGCFSKKRRRDRDRTHLRRRSRHRTLSAYFQNRS